MLMVRAGASGTLSSADMVGGGGVVGTQQDTQDVQGLIEVVAGRLAGLLAARRGPLAATGTLDQELLRNVEEILVETVRTVRSGQRPAAVSVDYVDPGFAATAELRAEQNVHPAESLMAAEALFDVAIEPVTVTLTKDGFTAADAARALHHAIWRRFPPGAIAYTNMLRRRLMTAEHDTRTQIARDLHDRVAHGILTSLQRVELAGRLPDDDARHTMLLDAATLLRGAVDDVRSVASRLREQVGGDGLQTAIRRFAEEAVAGAANLRITGTGTDGILMRWQEEEILAITLEAVRNAVRHAHPRTVRVHLSQQPDHVSVTISDDGHGMGTRQEDGLGLAGMRERAALLGATLTITTSSDGTTIALTVQPTAAVALGDGNRQ
ncbi:ATP-binding protein [Curtobacterium sp. MCBD17_040]|uniref:sensor histidine kinase n=1 Tax=Curtobacterium sp. MCBD17_040 TaxID=2175674 RepID=UPI000DA9B286|nr:ATP-binding protein [Curtobacterium sp. MCBD17_040]WIB65513.1 histidine kinase [Curtobacterium sp. MCBD17_040]